MSDRSIMVSVCTFRRPSLERTLLSVAAQDLPAGTTLRIAVADNDDTPSAEAVVAAVAASSPCAVDYLHAPARNISVARNALLDHAEARGIRLVAFLDDDEWVEPDWLARLLAALDETGADAVFGPIRGLHADDAPAWMRRGAFHDTRIETDGTGRVTNGYSGNALLDAGAPAFAGRRFDLALGRTGGEDTAYFLGAAKADAVLMPAPLAIASEAVPPERARAAWLARRRFRMGQTHAGLIGEGATRLRRVALATVAAAKGLACLTIAAAQAPFPTRRNRALLRGCLHAGAASGLLGSRTLILYGTAGGTGTGAAEGGEQP